MKNLKIMIVFCIWAISPALYSQQSVTLVSSETSYLPKNNCFYYMLPRTAFKVDVSVMRTNQIRGYFSKYAEKLLGLSNIIDTNTTSYSLHNISVSEYTIPDTSYLYAVELSSEQMKDHFLSKMYSTQDVLSTDVAITPVYSSQNPELPHFFKNYSTLTYVEKEDSFIETRIIDGIVTQIPVNKTKMVTKSVEQKAQEAADFIIKIRNDRYELTAGAQEVAYSKETLELLIKELTEWEKKYMDLFTGITIHDELRYSFIVIPKNATDTLLPLFSINESTGMADIDKKNKDDNYYLRIVPQISHAKWENFTQKVERKNKAKDKGYRIRKASPAQLSLLQGKNSLHDFGYFSVYQLGKIDILPTQYDNFDISKYGFIY